MPAFLVDGAVDFYQPLSSSHALSLGGLRKERNDANPEEEWGAIPGVATCSLEFDFRNVGVW